MMSLATLATKFDGYVQDGAILLAPERLAPFLDAAQSADLSVPYVECLFFGPDWTRPSMELSRNRDDFQSFDLFASFAREAAMLAAEQARLEGVLARFEVGVEE